VPRRLAEREELKTNILRVLLRSRAKYNDYLGEHDPIIERDLWDRVLDLMNSFPLTAADREWRICPHHQAPSGGTSKRVLSLPAAKAYAACALNNPRHSLWPRRFCSNTEKSDQVLPCATGRAGGDPDCPPSIPQGIMKQGGGPQIDLLQLHRPRNHEI
jgi:hypothetical protein